MKPGDLLPLSVASVIEYNVGIVCACMPTARLLLKKVWPVLFASSAEPSDEHFRRWNNLEPYRLYPSATQRSKRISRSVETNVNHKKRNGDEVELIEMGNWISDVTTNPPTPERRGM